MNNKNTIVNKEVVDITFKSITDVFSEYPNFQQKLSSMNVLMIPSNVLNSQDPFFPQGTIDLYQYLLRNSPPEIKVDIAILNDKYKEFPKYDETIEIATIILKDICVSIIFPLISSYIYDKYLSKKNEEKREIISEILIIKNDTTIAYKYCGPVDAYEKTILNSYNKSDAEEFTKGSEGK